MKKLSLEKQTVVKLSDAELKTVKGGGPNRSNRRERDCIYSKNNPGATVYCRPKE